MDLNVLVLSGTASRVKSFDFHGNKHYSFVISKRRGRRDRKDWIRCVGLHSVKLIDKLRDGQFVVASGKWKQFIKPDRTGVDIVHNSMWVQELFIFPDAVGLEPGAAMPELMDEYVEAPDFAEYEKITADI